MSDFEERSLEEQIFSTLSEYSDEILEKKDDIDLVLHENTHKVEKIVSQPTLTTVLSQHAITFTEDDSDQVARVILYLIAKFNSGLKATMREKSISEDFINFLSKMNVKYEGELDRVSRRSMEGNKFYNSLNTELVVRNSDNIGFRHQFEIDYSDLVEIDTDIESCFRLINSLLLAHQRAVEEYGEKALAQWNLYQLERIQENVNKLIEVNNKIASESDSSIETRKIDE